MSYQVSIALVTRNRPDRLKRALASVRAQTLQPYEVIISDDSNNPEAIATNKALADHFKCQYITGPQNGLYANRNHVAKHCQGTHFRTMDDDHTFPDDHFAKLMEVIEAEPKTIWTIPEYLPGKKVVDGLQPIVGQLHARGYSYNPTDLSEYYGISCGGTIYPTIVVQNNDLNSELFKFGMIYLEYGARLKWKGYIIKPVRNTYMIHHDEETSASTLPKEIMEEARLYSMLALSFRYQPTFKNKLMTIKQISKELFFKRYSIKTIQKVIKLFSTDVKNK